MAIPAKLEEMILEGKARFETYQAGFTEFNVIPVQSKEFIVITGFTFAPANTVFYTNGGLQTQTIQRIEFFDGNNYSHHIAKMSGSTNVSTQLNDQHEIIQPNLYLVFHNDVGIMVTVPINTALDLSSFRDDLDGSNGNTARKVINQGTNPYLTTAQSVQYATESASPGTLNIPANVKVNGPNYTNNMTGGPHSGQQTNQFQFTAEPEPVFYGPLVDYSSVDLRDLRTNWYLNVQYVRVFETGTNIR